MASRSLESSISLPLPFLFKAIWTVPSTHAVPLADCDYFGKRHNTKKSERALGTRITFVVGSFILFACFLFNFCVFFLSAYFVFTCMVLFSLACFLFYLRVLCFICVVPFLFACFVFYLRGSFFICVFCFLFAWFLFYLRGSFFICVVSFMLLCFADMGHRNKGLVPQIATKLVEAGQDEREDIIEKKLQ